MLGLHLSMQEMATALASVSGEAVKVKSFPWWLIRLASPFSIVCRGILEMRYLWQGELSLSGDKLHNLLGADLPTTDIHTVLSVSLAPAYRCGFLLPIHLELSLIHHDNHHNRAIAETSSRLPEFSFNL